jgi:hypothetical protein
MSARKIYVITTDRGVCKIGISNNPILRLEQLQTGAAFPLRLVYAFVHSEASRIEAMVHHELQARHTYGEWFSVSDEVARDAIYRAAAKLGKPIKGSGYGPADNKLRFWFWIVLAVIVMWAAFSFVFAYRAHPVGIVGNSITDQTPPANESYCVGVAPENCGYAWTFYDGRWVYSSWKDPAQGSIAQELDRDHGLRLRLPPLPPRQ